MNSDLMSGFETANFILKSRQDYTGMFVDESKKTKDRIRSNRIHLLSEKLKELHESIDELEKLKNDYIKANQKIKQAHLNYDQAFKERVKYDYNIQNKSQLES